MGRSPCCEQDADVKKGPWTPEEDKLLVEYIGKNGHGSWRRLPKLAGLNRCGKSCRLRWTNYLRPDIKRGGFSDDEERLIIHLHATLGNKWSSIATKLKGRTDNEIKNYWNTHLRKKLLSQGIDPVTHRPRTDLLAGLPNLLAAANLGGAAHQLPLDLNAIKLQADAAKFQILQGLLRVLASTTAPPPTAAVLPGTDLMTSILGATLAANSAGILGQQQQLAGVDLSRLGQYNGNYDNLPPLTNDSCTQQTQPAMSSMSPDSLLNRISSGISGDMLGSPELCHGGDGLSSPELGQGGPSASNMTTSPMAPPPPMVAADDHQCNTNTPSGGGDGMSCEQTPASSTFDGLNLDDIDMEGCWAMTDILLAEQCPSWLISSNNASEMYISKNNTSEM
ncbi:transcription factor MYB53 [Oryza sativa Japonica Group]|nr:transcription factor MYB53 [Oryza sativa Japonica Group]XP_052159694.1 transcription factor MYB53-like [Oryza glaberrima]KAF2924831.1 hypothetical protein DAI22_06g007500 [Oryza sativa Japonica Group]